MRDRRSSFYVPAFLDPLKHFLRACERISVLVGIASEIPQFLESSQQHNKFNIGAQRYIRVTFCRDRLSDHGVGGMVNIREVNLGWLAGSQDHFRGNPLQIVGAQPVRTLSFSIRVGGHHTSGKGICADTQPPMQSFFRMVKLMLQIEYLRIRHTRFV